MEEFDLQASFLRVSLTQETVFVMGLFINNVSGQENSLQIQSKLPIITSCLSAISSPYQAMGFLEEQKKWMQEASHYILSPTMPLLNSATACLRRVERVIEDWDIGSSRAGEQGRLSLPEWKEIERRLRTMRSAARDIEAAMRRLEWHSGLSTPHIDPIQIDLTRTLIACAIDKNKLRKPKI